MEIELSTRKNNHIINFQHSERLSLLEIADNESNMATYLGCTYRTDPCGFYNCHGLTFASRRTRIYETTELRKIISDDDYEYIEITNVFPGDIILYITKLGAIIHSGIILTVESIGNEVIPIILSKWGSGSEVVHNFKNCPYWQTDTIIEFYRIRSIHHRGIHVAE